MGCCGSKKAEEQTPNEGEAASETPAEGIRSQVEEPSPSSIGSQTGSKIGEESDSKILQPANILQ